METNGKFYLAKINEKNKYSTELRTKIEEAGNYCLKSLDEINYSPIMALGRIQSGKTRAYVGLIALALDNNFDLIIVLSKNSKALVDQTFKRLNKEFSSFVQSKQLIIKDILTINGKQELTNYEKTRKQIVVCKKQKHNLQRIDEYIRINHFDKNKRILVIDDEADITSIGFVRDKEADDETFTMQRIADKIDSIRGGLKNSVFVQVTATPYALYLQPQFDKEEILPLRPDKTIVIPSGNGYFGGLQLFEENASYYKYIGDKELEFITNNALDGRSIDKNKLVGAKIINTFIESIFTFIVGGCVLRMKNMIDEAEFLSFVVHTNTQKNKHTNAETIVNDLLMQLSKTKRSLQSVDIELKIEKAYKTISKTIVDMPTIEKVKNAFYKSIDDGTIKAIVVNSDNDVKTYLNDDGEIDLTTPFTIIIGGQTLDRGITISNMVGFYYGRNPKTTQQDTVMQHMRIFGYRKVSHLQVTKFYTSRLIFERLKKSVEIDEALRDSIEKGDLRDSLYLLKCDSGVRPCARNKIAVSDIIYVRGKQRILPIGFDTHFKSYTAKNLSNIDALLLRLRQETDETYLVDCKEIKNLISEVYAILVKENDSARYIDKRTFFDIIDSMQKNKFCLIIRRGRNLGKYKADNSFSDAPDTKTETPLAYLKAEQYPVLMLIEQNGLIENGWKGSKFWWPVLVTPVTSSRMMMALDESRVKVKKRS